MLAEKATTKPADGGQQPGQEDVSQLPDDSRLDGHEVATRTRISTEAAEMPDEVGKEREVTSSSGGSTLWGYDAYSTSKNRNHRLIERMCLGATGCASGV